MQTNVQLALEELYRVFAHYQIGEPQQVSCFDLGPTADEVVGISQSLHQIPDSTIASMEFFSYGWDSWGTKEEVGYFLPRLLEYLTHNIDNLDSPAYFSLFKFKLANLFSATNTDWNPQEKQSISTFVLALLSEQLTSNPDIGMLLEWALTLDVQPQQILSQWQADTRLYHLQLCNLFAHFESELTQPSHPQGLYLEDSRRIQRLLERLLAPLSEAEIYQIDAIKYDVY